MSPSLKYWFNIGTFYETIRPCIVLLKCCGLLPFTLSRGTTQSSSSAGGNNNFRLLKSEVKFMDVIIFALWQMFFLQMLYASWPNDFYNIPVSRIITVVSLVLQLISGIFCSSSAVVALLFRQRFVRMVELVEESDLVFHTHFNEIQHSEIHLLSVAMIACTFFLNILLVVIDVLIRNTMMKLDYPNPMEYAFLYCYILRLTNLLSVAVLIVGLYAFRERLRELNKQLRTMYFLEQPAIGPIRSSGDVTEKIQGLIVIYSQLCDGLRLFCTIFIWQPMLLCAMLIVSAVFAILALCNMLTNNAPILKALALVYSIATALIMLYFLLVVKLGSDVKKEGKHTAVLVHKAINQSSKTPAVVDRLLLFSRYLQHHTPVVSCGLFCFDWTLALSIISALATYSVIVIQFELGVPRFFISAILQLYADQNVTTS